MTTKILSFIVGLALAINATAAEKKPSTVKISAGPTTAAKTVKHYPYHANVAAVDVAAKTITLEGKKKQRVLYITPITRILKDKKPVALETVKVGDYVTGSLRDTDGHLEPTTVNIGGTSSHKTVQAAPTAPTTPTQKIAVKKQ